MQSSPNSQLGFTRALTFKQSFVEMLKYCKSMKVFVTSQIGSRREQSSQLKSQCSGFTLIEMIVSLAVFTTVIGISVGALLILVGSNQQLQAEQGVMTNLSFALDSMTREIRTGTNYYCESRPNKNGANNIFNDSSDLDAVLGDSVQDCANGRQGSHNFHGISFREGGDSITTNSAERILYYHDAGDGKIYRRVGAGTAQSIVSSGIFISDMDFYVTGSEPLDGSGPNTEDQSSVTIFIEARDVNDPNKKPYQIQTTITQRVLDI